MDTTLSSDRAYFDANGKLIFHFSNRSAYTSASRAIDEALDNAILNGRQSPAAAILAAAAVLVFGFVSAQSSLFSLTRVAAVSVVATTAQGFAVLSSDLMTSVQQKTEIAYGQLWGQSEPVRALPFAELAARAQGAISLSAGGGSQATHGPVRSVQDLEQTHVVSLAAAALASVSLSAFTPSAVPVALRDAYLALGVEVYGGITASMQAYKNLIAVAGVKAYALGAASRDAIILVPSVALQGLTALGGTIISTTHLAISTETALVYQFVDLSPRIARSITLAVGNTGAYLGQSVATKLPRVLAWAIQEPSIAGPAMSQVAVNTVYENAQRFVYATGVVRTTYGNAVTRTGNVLYSLAIDANALGEVPVDGRVRAVAARVQSVYGSLVTHSSYLLTSVFAGARTLAPSGQ